MTYQIMEEFHFQTPLLELAKLAQVSHRHGQRRRVHLQTPWTFWIVTDTTLALPLPGVNVQLSQTGKGGAGGRIQVLELLPAGAILDG